MATSDSPHDRDHDRDPDHGHDHDHGPGCDHEHGSDGEDTPSTGFLPLSLAVGLFVTGLFVLGIVRLPSCHTAPEVDTPTSPGAPDPTAG